MSSTGTPTSRPATEAADKAARPPRGQSGGGTRTVYLLRNNQPVAVQITPGVTACTLMIRLKPSESGTDAEVTYTHTSLGPAGDEALGRLLKAHDLSPRDERVVGRLAALARKFEGTRFEPSGHTTNPKMREASSITDYVFRWLGFVFSAGYAEDYEARMVHD